MEEMVRRTVGPAIALETVLAEDLWTTLCDASQLENAVLNLCINARDAMPDGGKLTIETANTTLDPRAARGQDMTAGEYVMLCVTDTGTGMAPDVIERAFDPFYTTKPIGQGTGLGLSMAYGFAKQSGGQVRIHSTVGKGTTVCFYLPRYLGEVDADVPLVQPSETHRARAGETILVIDDDPSVRMLVTEVLEELGYAAIEAIDGKSGLKVLQSNAGVDLLITDVGLPGGINGRQIADAARITRQDLKVLFITGYAESAVVRNGHLEPGMEIMIKPFTMEALAARIQNILSDPPHAATEVNC
jgi:CheY-like chemotaxis protein